MLRRLSDIVADCYKRASDAANRAREANDPGTKDFWLRAEERWLKMANHLEFGERVTSFIVNRDAVSAYTVREVAPNSWEWMVYGTGDRILAAGSAHNMVEARVMAFQYISDLFDDRVQ